MGASTNYSGLKVQIYYNADNNLGVLMNTLGEELNLLKNLVDVDIGFVSLFKNSNANKDYNKAPFCVISNDRNTYCGVEEIRKAIIGLRKEYGGR